MAVIEIAKIQVRRGQESTTGVPQLDPGEFGWAEDTQNLYIGKRISEGANSDENARILTDKDLNNFLDMIGFGGTGSVASTSTYRYRDMLPYGQFQSTTTSIAKKLDNWVSLTDFAQNTVNGDITQLMRKAIENLYANSYLGTDTVRILKLPAGSFSISGVIDLPPYASLVGEGIGVTTLVMTNNGVNMFRTVDGQGNSYNYGMMYNSDASKEIYLSDMTLAYAENNHNDAALISLDNTENPIIENVKFTTLGAHLNTSTFVSTGTGIAIRGSIGSDESSIICKNIQVRNCQFENIRLGLHEEGLVSRPMIQNNLFKNLHRGLFVTSTGTTLPLPSNTLLSNNKFNFIREEAIFVSTNTNSSGVISLNNTYHYVGNLDARPDQNVTYPARSIMQFNAPGNVSINDHFNRREISLTTGTFYYNKIASGNAQIKNDKMYKATVLAGNQNQVFVRVPLTGNDQMGTIDYQLTNSDMSRKGTLTLNISPDGYASVSDYYNYSELVQDASTLLVFSTGLSKSPYGGGTLNYIEVTCSSFATTSTGLEYSINLSV